MPISKLLSVHLFFFTTLISTEKYLEDLLENHDEDSFHRLQETLAPLNLEDSYLAVYQYALSENPEYKIAGYHYLELAAEDVGKIFCAAAC